MFKTQTNNEKYQHYFKDYPVFQLFVEHAFKYMEIVIFVDKEENPSTIIIEAKPAYILYGKPTTDLTNILHPGAWIISPSDQWDEVLKSVFQNNLETYQRILCDESKLSTTHLLEFDKELPEELRIEPITKEHIQAGMIKDDVINRFFPNVDFLTTGFGLALVNNENIVHGFALTNYPIQSDEIEVYYRVGYESFTKYRNQGIGTLIASKFIIESLHRGYKPIWDAATPLSYHIANKLGYQDKLHWQMHHLKP